MQKKYIASHNDGAERLKEPTRRLLGKIQSMRMWYVVERQKKNGKWKFWDDVVTPERAEEICNFRRKVCPDEIWRWRAEPDEAVNDGPPFFGATQRR
jgi:hypothetical protein